MGNGLSTPGLLHGRAWVADDATTMLREKPVKIGAKAVAHGRTVTFQLAEVAVPSALFAEILRPMDGRRPAPLPP